MLYSFFIELVLLFLNGIVGMALIPDVMRSDNDNEKIVPFMLAPTLGAAVWLSLSVFFGMLFSYNAALLILMAVAFACFVFVRRHRLFFVCDKAALIFVIVSLLFSLLVMYGVMPHKIGSGLYFTESAYDHVRIAIVHSISANGLPPLNPWLADGGKPLVLSYYFGWHAWAAQLSLLFRVRAIDAETIMTGLTALLAVLTIGALCIKLTKRKMSLFFAVLLLCASSITDAQLKFLLPKALYDIFSVPYLYYWSFLDNVLWGPHHEFSASVVLLVIYLYTLLLKNRDKKRSFTLALLLGVLAAASFFTSVYAGTFALFFFVLMMIPVYATDRKLGKDFNASFVFQLLAAAFALLLFAQFFYYMLQYYPETSPLVLEICPYYIPVSGFTQIVKHWCWFYLFVLPCRISLPYVLGIAALLIPGVLPDNRFVKLGKYFTFLLLSVIFFIHSSFYSNDFGWRTPTAAYMFCIIFASVLSVKIYDRLKRSGRIYANIFIVLFISFPLFFHSCFTEQLISAKGDPKLHTAFAGAAKGWRVVRKHTGKNELVMCNPESFKDMPNKINGVYTNIFFSFYADRYTPLADLIFSKCYSEYYSEKKLEERYANAVKFFAGDPSAEDVAYAADVQKVKAFLITPYDGLWERIGALETRYRKVSETEYYRV
ncbi:MAG: hypothetical protein Q4E17_07535, partial [Synergistes sp.]|nr:hypothetical protein [Synergistes sp.]